MYVDDSDDELVAAPVLDEADQERLSELEAELASVDKQIGELRVVRNDLKSRIGQIHAQAAKRNLSHSAAAAAPPVASTSAADYTASTFPWSRQIKETAQEVWGIRSFRHCQEAVINAALDNRDIVCLMPTGGGKSLCFQLPAILSEGTTIVVTPLISLMQDQVFNLTNAGQQAAMIHASTPKDNIKAVMAAMTGASAKGKGKVVASDVMETPKLVYVTPERIDKAKTFINALQKMYDSGRLARIVIDEAHCVSSLGHDYRPAYLSLSKLKSLFPKVPIIALTATATGKVISDMLKILGMPARISAPESASHKSTILFSSPLYRPNLHYRIVPKPSKADDVIAAIVDYITSEHLGESGIIYCLSRNDTEAIAKGVLEHSKGKVRTAIYHAWIDDEQKVRVHEQWRSKRIHVVVATNASFGLGIDAPDVRFVIHHTMAKNVESFYQESGRAGRDGLPSDCLTFYRAGDASKISTLIYDTFNKGGGAKLYDMIRMAEDFRTCRNVTFARYFKSAQTSQSFNGNGGDDQPCGHCDNCLRKDEEVTSVDMSLSAYRALQILSAAHAQRATLTLKQAIDLVRGLGGGKFATAGSNGSKGAGVVDVNNVAGGKVTLNADRTEALLVRLLIDGYLREVFHATTYSIISYVQVTSLAARFTRRSPADVERDGVPVKLSMAFLGGGGSKPKPGKAQKAMSNGASKKRKRKDVTPPVDSDDEDDQDAIDEILGMPVGDGMDLGSDALDEDGWQVYQPGRKRSKQDPVVIVDDD